MGHGLLGAAAEFDPLRRLDLSAAPPLILAEDGHRLGMHDLRYVGTHRIEVAASAEGSIEDVLHVNKEIEFVPRSPTLDRE